MVGVLEKWQASDLQCKEIQTIGYVWKSIPCFYAVLYNRQSDHHTSIIEIEGKFCDQFVSILIDLRSNYSYVNPYMVDKCGFNK